MSKYAVGIDFGSLSARAVVADVADGREAGCAVCEYPHAVMDEHLPSGRALPPDWALQYPHDYIHCMNIAVREAVAQAGVSPADIIGVGIDFTACTVLPVDKEGVPLCEKAGFSDNPHAYVKLWKHHAAQKYANMLNDTAARLREDFLARYGGKISSEWLIPKIWQTLDEAPDVYDAADRFMEAADWVIMRLTGNERRNACTAGYKGIWHKAKGYPTNDFFKALDPRLEFVVDKKLSRDIYPAGARAGGLTAEAADGLGLMPGTAVAVANVDAHVSMPAAGITKPGAMLMIMGTSTCHILLGDSEKHVPGICGVVEDGVLPGYFGYEAGQSCVGDHFEWFVENCVPKAYHDEAAEKGISIHQLLRAKVQAQPPGRSGLLALDWFNGNRSVLVDADLTGMILGMTLATKPEEIYRALIEATAYGTRMIIDGYEQSGVPVNSLVACGGITGKDPMMMQIYADVTGRRITIAKSKQAPALGSAMFGAVAAGKSAGGFDDIESAAKKMGGVEDKSYEPNPGAVRVYEALYRQYAALHDYFGRGANDVMKELKKIRGESFGAKGGN